MCSSTGEAQHSECGSLSALEGHMANMKFQISPQVLETFCLVSSPSFSFREWSAQHKNVECSDISALSFLLFSISLHGQGCTA